ncbi:MAG: slipin family protein [Spirochaetaceae bacterium]|jgi:regulator of protease activity HflC (stomatin/prohibitin superfamily)|nr:slipin family protein [Spirochaetaceae bacterium]
MIARKTDAAAAGSGVKKRRSAAVYDAELVKNRTDKRRRPDWGITAAGFWVLAAWGAFLCWRVVSGWLAAGGLVWGGGVLSPLDAALPLLALLVSCVRKAAEWERAVVLRFGKFHKVKGPGLFIRLPFIDTVAEKIDIRIRVSDFSAQETLTLDSVTVTVDAVCFWHIWDPEKALLEVENYEEAVVLSAKTALRSAVSSHDLSAFLAHGELVETQIRGDVDRKTTDWGITIHHIEITDVQVPEELQDALSRKAQAERERAGRVLLADAEIEIARKLQEAVAVYAGDSTALRLKILSILNEGFKAGNSMMLVPNSVAEALQATGILSNDPPGT